jgi:hypothetical protein
MTGEYKHDFRKEIGSKKDAITSFAFSLIAMVGIPLVLILFSKDIGAWLASFISGMSADDLGSAIKLVNTFANTYLLFGLPILLLSIPIGFYPQGSWSRLTFRLMSGIYAVFWLYMILAGGVFTINATDLAQSMNTGMTELSMTIDIRGFMWVLLALSALRNIVPIAEFYGARDEFLHGPKNKNRTKRVDRTVRVKGRHQGD